MGLVCSHEQQGSRLTAQKGKIRCGDSTESVFRALLCKPDFADAHSDLACALAQRDNPDQTIKNYAERLRIKPDFVIAHNNFGILLGEWG